MKNIKKYILASGFIVASSLLTGCSQSATSVFIKDPIYAQNLQYTKVGKIIKNKEVEALINVTYLNSVDSAKWDNGKQNFIIGTYITNDTNLNFKLTMNGKNPLKYETIQKTSNLYKNIAFKNHWGKYNIVTFENTKDKKVQISYSNQQKGTITISFDKE